MHGVPALSAGVPDPVMFGRNIKQTRPATIDWSFLLFPLTVRGGRLDIYIGIPPPLTWRYILPEQQKRYYVFPLICLRYNLQV